MIDESETETVQGHSLLAEKGVTETVMEQNGKEKKWLAHATWRHGWKGLAHEPQSHRLSCELEALRTYCGPSPV